MARLLDRRVLWSNNIIIIIKHFFCVVQRSSTLAGDLVARLLDRNPDTRIAAAAALEHPWVKVRVCVCVCG